MVSKQLSGKSVLITGASRGIGAAAAIAIAEAGASDIVLHYNSFQEGAEETATRVRSLGANVSLRQADLGHMDGIRSLLSDIKDRSFDILINNAGHLVQRAKLLESTEEIYDVVFNLNTKSMWFITQAIVPSMIEKKSGVIVNVSSIAARNGGGPGGDDVLSRQSRRFLIYKGLGQGTRPAWDPCERRQSRDRG